jgi:hypothetical protein
MTKFSKVLAIFVTVASLAFLGFAAAVFVGGPNWDAERQRLSDRYVFEYSGGDSPTWTAKDRDGKKTIKTSPVLAEVVIACRDDMVKKQQAVNDELRDRAPKLSERLEQGRKAIQEDRQALEHRAQMLIAEIKEANKSIDETINKGIGETNTAIATRDEVTLRMKDAFRLQAELDQIRTEQYGIDEQKRKLQDILHRLDGVLYRLERREQQLKKQSGSSEDYDPQAKPEKKSQAPS